MPIVEGAKAAGGAPPGEHDIADGPDSLPPPGLTLEQAHIFHRHGAFSCITHTRAIAA
jgi:hypothetical protein